MSIVLRTHNFVRTDESRWSQNETQAEAQISFLLRDGSVADFGRDLYQATDEERRTYLNQNVVEITTAHQSSAVLKSDGSVFVYGGAQGKSYSTYSNIAPLIDSGVIDLYGSGAGYAALKDDGSLVSWGLGQGVIVEAGEGGGIKDVYSTDRSFAALLNDGSIRSWGYANSGAQDYIPFDDVSDELAGVEIVNVISTNRDAWAALGSDGSVTTWGRIGPGNPADSSPVSDELKSGVIKLASSNWSFAALKEDGNVVTWGNEISKFPESYNEMISTDPIIDINGLRGDSHAATLESGKIILWGSDTLWGLGENANPTPLLNSDEIVALYSYNSAAALKSDGSAEIWGNFSFQNPNIANEPQQDFSKDIAEIIPGTYTNIVIKEDGSAGTFADGGFVSGDYSSVKDQLSSGVVSAVSQTQGTFVFKNDNSIVYWRSGSAPFGTFEELYGNDIAQTRLDGGEVIDLASPRTDVRIINSSVELPTFVGPFNHLIAGSTVEVFANGELLGTTEAGDFGRWSFEAPESLIDLDGFVDITANAIDESGERTPIEVDFFYGEVPSNEPDLIVGELDLKSKINSKSKGVTPFRLFGNSDLDVTLIDVNSLEFGLGSADDALTDWVGSPVATRKKPIASFDDINNDGSLDMLVKTKTTELLAATSCLDCVNTAFVKGLLADSGEQFLFTLSSEDSVTVF